MLRVHLFSTFTIKSPRALAALAPLGLFIVKTLQMYSKYNIKYGFCRKVKGHIFGLTNHVCIRHTVTLIHDISYVSRI